MIIAYYIQAIIAFLILTVYGLYGFFTRRVKKGSKLVYSILGLQAAWLLVMLVMVIFKK